MQVPLLVLQQPLFALHQASVCIPHESSKTCDSHHPMTRDDQQQTVAPARIAYSPWPGSDALGYFSIRPGCTKPDPGNLIPHPHLKIGRIREHIRKFKLLQPACKPGAQLIFYLVCESFFRGCHLCGRAIHCSDQIPCIVNRQIPDRGLRNHSCHRDKRFTCPDEVIAPGDCLYPILKLDLCGRSGQTKHILLQQEG